MQRLDGAGIEGPLAPYGAGFAQWLVSQGYATLSVHRHLKAMDWLSRQLAGSDLSTETMSEEVVHRFHRAAEAAWRWAATSGTRTATEVPSRPRNRGAVGGEVRPVTAATPAVSL